MFPLAQSQFSMCSFIVHFVLRHEPGEVNLEISGHEKKWMKFKFLASDVSVFGGVGGGLCGGAVGDYRICPVVARRL